MVTFSDETLFRIQPWVRRVRSIIGALGWLARLQWFVNRRARATLERETPVSGNATSQRG